MCIHRLLLAARGATLSSQLRAPNTPKPLPPTPKRLPAAPCVNGKESTGWMSLFQRAEESIQSAGLKQSASLGVDGMENVCVASDLVYIDSNRSLLSAPRSGEQVGETLFHWPLFPHEYS